MQLNKRQRYAVVAVAAVCAVGVVLTLTALGLFAAWMGVQFALGGLFGFLFFNVAFRIIEGYWWEPY